MIPREKLKRWATGVLMVVAVTLPAYISDREAVERVARDQKICESTGGDYAPGKNCPFCLPFQECKPCFVGCTCPDGKLFKKSEGCK